MFFNVLLSQVVISVVVVAIYHLWVCRKKQAAPAPPVAVAPVVPVPLVVPVPVAPKVLPPVELPPSPEILAVIAAAIAAVLDKPHKVVAIQQATALAPRRQCMGHGRTRGTILIAQGPVNSHRKSYDQKTSCNGGRQILRRNSGSPGRTGFSRRPTAASAGQCTLRAVRLPLRPRPSQRPVAVPARLPVLWPGA